MLLICMSLFVLSVWAAAPGDIVVNEIMFNGPESGTDNEWVELYNITFGPIELDSNWSLSDGEGTFIFSRIIIGGGEYLTIKVCQNATEPFPFTPDIDATGFGITLSNTSDEVFLVEGTTVIDSVAYSDTWGADGDGKTLERVDPLAPSNDPANWGPSLPAGGTPGAVNSIHGGGGDYPPAVTGIAHSPLNPGPLDNVTVTATITDDGAITKAMLFYNIDLGPNDSLSMADDGFHGDGASGDDVWGAIIPPATAGSTVRYFIVVEDDSLYSDTTWTYAYGVVSGDTIDGDVVINEIMYNPASPHSDNYFEYIELYNRGSAPVFLSGWVLKDNSDFNTFVFPYGGVAIGSGEYLVVAKAPDSIQAFYAISGVVGPVTWSLNNSGGDAVRLYNEAGTLMDYVNFLEVAPWPTAPNGAGPSLELIDPSFDNNLASSWRASGLRGSPGGFNTSVAEAERPVKICFAVKPNPFNSTASVSVNLPENGRVRLSLFSLDGRDFGEVFEGNLIAGQYQFPLDLGDCPSGLYLIRLDHRGGTETVKALLIR